MPCRSAQRLIRKAAVDHSVRGIFVTVEDTIVAANQALSRILGCASPDELKDRLMSDFIHPTDRLRVLDRWRECQDGARAEVRAEARALTEQGGAIDISLWGQAVHCDKQRAVLTTIHDVTEARRRSRENKAILEIFEALSRSNDLQQLLGLIHGRISGLMSALNFYVALLDETTQYVSFAYWADECDEKPDPRKARKGLTEYVIRTGKSLLYTDDMARKLEAQGEMVVIGTIAASWLGVPLLRYGKPVGAMVVQCYDRAGAYGEDDRILLETLANPVMLAIDRQLADDALTESASKYRALFETANDGIFILSGGIIVDCNRHALRMFGATREGIIGRDPVELSFREQPDGRRPEGTVQGLLSRVEAGESMSFQWVAQKMDGTGFEVEVSLSRLEFGGRLWVQAIVHDVSERARAVEEQNRLREQLAHAQKMEAIGTLAGGIAHDFNNLLAGIMGYASLAKSQFDTDHPHWRVLDTIEKSATRAAELTSQLLGFARRGRYQVQPTDMNGVADRVVSIISRTFDRKIVVEISHDPDLRPVDGDPGQLEQCLMNLCVNSRDAMPAGGTLSIGTANAVVGPRHSSLMPDLRPGEFVVLTVKDTGIGMDSGVQARIFEPFFTTKELGKGTGMGLAMVYGIVKSHDGTVIVESSPGKGATFRIYLPASSMPLPEKPAQVPEVRRGSEKVLVVDDEPVVREMVDALLKELGYEVVLASGGEEACQIYGSARPQLVILDVVMPGMSGLETYEALRQIDPGVRVLVSSGHTDEGQPSEMIEMGAKGFIQKPYSLREFSQAVWKTLH